MVISEVLPTDDEIRRLISKGCTFTDLRDAARKAGMQTMFETGIKKVEEGITSLDEILGVTVS
jgi:type II secretory ATPase GspE/PulE/Tfp pilus assembly ATPase PilB-like protein